MTEEIQFRVDLVQQAINHVAFLRTVHEAEDLRRRDVINAAIYRYANYWLPLAAEHPTECLSAPLDIEWVWHCHMLAPGRYANDCNAITKTVVNHTVRSGEEYENALLTSEKYWQQKYKEPGNPFQYDLIKSYKNTTNISISLFGAVERQKKFFYQVSLPHYRDRKFLAGALVRYTKFLHLKRAMPALTVVPCFDIDLLWHTHQLNPRDYDRDSCEVLGYRLVHDDNVGGQPYSPGFKTASSQLHKDSVNTATHWQAIYKDPYFLAGAMYRGPPLSSNEDSDKPYSLMGVMVTSISTDTFYINGGQLVSEANYDEMQLVVASAKGDYFIGELEAHTVPDLFRVTVLFDRPLFFDTSNNEKFELQFELIHKRQGMCFKHDKRLAKTTWRAPLSNIIHWLTKKKRTFYDCPYLGNGAHLSLEGSFATSLSNMSELVYYLEEGPVRSADASEVGADMHTHWGPFPMEDPWQGDGRKACLVASHRLRYREKDTGWPFYSAKIVHIMSSSLFLIQICDRKDHVVAAAHLIGPEQLPRPDKVGMDCLSLDQDKEMAILIKSTSGDWGILTGVSTGASARVKTELGYNTGDRRGVEMNFYKLPEGKKVACHVDEKFMFFRTTGVDVNLVEGSVKMDPVFAFEMGEVLALAFSACVMIMLCTQETKSANVSEGKQSHAETTDSQQVDSSDDHFSATDNVQTENSGSNKERASYSQQGKALDNSYDNDNVTESADSVQETADSSKTNACNFKVKSDSFHESIDKQKPNLDAWKFYHACALGETSFNGQLVQSDVTELCAVCAGYHSYTRAKIPSKEPPAPTKTAEERAAEEQRERDDQFWRHTKTTAGMCLGCGPSGCRGYR